MITAQNRQRRDMFNLFQKTTRVALLAALLYSGSVYAQLTTLAEAVDMAGKQRMLTQKMLKEYALIGMDNHYKNPTKKLKNSIKKYDEDLKKLLQFAKDEKLIKSLKRDKSEWLSIKKILQSKPDKDTVPALQEKLDLLLKHNNDTVKLEVGLSKKSSASTVDLAGRQRMLSQRMAGLYMMKVWGVDDPKFHRKLDEAMSEFKSAHKKLLKNPLNTKEIDALLKKVSRSFRFFDMMAKTKTKSFVPSLISRSSTKILKNMDKVTKLYAKELK